MLGEDTFCVYIARQPIFDRGLKVHAYELLYRCGHTSSAGVITGRESAQSLINSFLDLGLPKLCGRAQAYLNIDEHLLGSELLTLLPQDRVVLEIVETVEPTLEAIEAVRNLAKAGYTIALDDYVGDQNSKPFLPYARIIKLDVRQMGRDLHRQIQKAKAGGAVVLAEKIETHEELQQCRLFGAELFQGFFLAKPEVVEGASVAPNKLAALKVVANLQSPDASVDEIEEVIVTDLALSYRLLRLVKSAALGLPERAGTIRSAIMFLGLPMVASLASILALSSCSTKPAEILELAYIRAKMCEIIASRTQRPGKDRFFTVGLFSILDALLDLPMRQILEQLSLHQEIAAALSDMNTPNDLANALRTVVAFERGDWNSLAFNAQLNEAYVQAIEWASAVLACFGAGQAIAA